MLNYSHRGNSVHSLSCGRKKKKVCTHFPVEEKKKCALTFLWKKRSMHSLSCGKKKKKYITSVHSLSCGRKCPQERVPCQWCAQSRWAWAPKGSGRTFGLQSPHGRWCGGPPSPWSCLAWCPHGPCCRSEGTPRCAQLLSSGTWRGGPIYSCLGACIC